MLKDNNKECKFCQKVPRGILIDGVCHNCDHLRTLMEKDPNTAARILNDVRGITNLQDKLGNGIWSEHPKYDRYEWGEEAYSHDTVLGYWEWVMSKIENEKEDDSQTEMEL